MKNKYKTPAIKVEELTKADVLCTSSEAYFNTPDNNVENFDSFGEFWDMSGLM